MRALLDTSVLIAALEPEEASPDLSGVTELMISSLSFSELYMGVAAAGANSSLREDRESGIARTRAAFGAGIPYDDRCALALGVVSEQVLRSGGSPRSNILDKMIAATAMAHGLVLVTRNAKDLRHLSQLVQVEVR